MKPIPGYERRYLIDEVGNIQSLSDHSHRIGKFLRVHEDKKGYLAAKLFIGGNGKNFYVHTLVALTFLGKKPEGLTVNHKDTNKKNNHYSNLEYLSIQENLEHAKKLGLLKGRPKKEEVTINA